MTEQSQSPPDAEERHPEILRYRQLFDRLNVLSSLSMRKVFGDNSKDPRLPFLGTLETARAVARAELNAFTRLMLEHLGVEQAVWLKVMNEEMAQETARLQQELGVAGYSDDGEPILGEVADEPA